MKKLLVTEEPQLLKFRDLIYGEGRPVFRDETKIDLPELNFSQVLACQKMEAAQDIAVVHGPPGTGKTTTLIAAISRSTRSNQRILVCAPSNAALDLLVEKLTDKGISTLRLGHPARVEEKILNQTLDAKIALHDSYRDLKKLRKETESYLQLAKQYKRNFGPEERAQRKLLYQEVSRIRELAEHLEDYIRSDVYQKTQVFASTLVGAGSHHLKENRFNFFFFFPKYLGGLIHFRIKAGTTAQTIQSCLNAYRFAVGIQPVLSLHPVKHPSKSFWELMGIGREDPVAV